MVQKADRETAKLKAHIEESARTAIIHTEGNWKANSVVLTGRGRASLTASVGMPATINPNPLFLSVRSLISLAQQGIQRVEKYKLEDGDLFIRSGILYYFNVWKGNTIVNAIMTGLNEARKIRGR